MDIINKLPTPEKCKAFSTKEFIFFLIVFVLLILFAIYLSAPDNYFSRNMVEPDSAQLQSTLTNTQTENTSEPSLEKNSKPGFLAGLLKSDKKQSIQETENILKHVVVEMTAEHQEYLQDSYNELYDSQYSNNQDKHLPSISGRVLDPNGKVLKGIEVKAVTRNYFTGGNKNIASLPSITTTTNADGFFAFADLEDGIYLLNTKNNKRYLPKSIEVRTGVKFADIVLAEMQLLELAGRVIDAATGETIPAVVVTPLAKGTPKSSISDTQGEFELDFPIGYESSISLKLRKIGYKDASYSVDTNAWESLQDVVVEMQKIGFAYGAVTGFVKSYDSDYLSGHLVHLYSPSLNTNYKTRSSNTGEYNFVNIEEANDYRVWVRPEYGYMDFEQENLEVASDPVKFDIYLKSLEQGYRLSGQVVDVNNQPLKNITLALRSVSARNQVFPVTTNSSGAYSVENVPAGEIVIESRSAPYYTVSGIELSGSNKSSHQNFIVDRGTEKLLGKVVNESGEPIAAPRIYISSKQTINGLRTQSSRNTSADSDGKFLFTNLGAQHYTITVNAPGYIGARIKHNLNMRNPLVVTLSKKTI